MDIAGYGIIGMMLLDGTLRQKQEVLRAGEHHSLRDSLRLSDKLERLKNRKTMAGTEW